MSSTSYRAQVDLLLQILPYVAEEECFALKGGTAINLFVREMPRLSVDIDLTYLPFDDRSTALDTIDKALGAIKSRIAKALPSAVITSIQHEGQDAKLICRYQAAQVKIEVNTIMRGHLLPPRLMPASEHVQEVFGKFAEIQVVSHGELFGGKLCAALDRQHPRDIFDVYHLLENEGFSEETRLGFISLLVSHTRPINEVLNPKLQDQRVAFDTKFVGMSTVSFSYDDYELTRERMIKELHAQLTDDDKDFLLSFKRGEPHWELFPLNKLKDMPAVQWKLLNIRKLIKQDPKKHTQQLKALEEKL
jgi:predicted nucleotidyltransferase component of viral defense system